MPRCPSMARANVPGPADRIRPRPGARDMRHASVGSACLPTARVESASARRTQRCQATGTCVRRECAPHLRRRPPRPANPPATRSQMSGQRTAAGPWQERADQSCRTGPGLARNLWRGVNDGVRADRISRWDTSGACTGGGSGGHCLRRAGGLAACPAGSRTAVGR